jgi:hypothetical protein
MAAGLRPGRAAKAWRAGTTNWLIDTCALLSDIGLAARVPWRCEDIIESATVPGAAATVVVDPAHDFAASKSDDDSDEEDARRQWVPFPQKAANALAERDAGG